jgi:hypothetical protein
VRLISAKVGGDLYLQGNFDFPGEEPVAADGIVVTGTTFMSGVRTNGLLRLVQADLKQGLYVDEAEFDTGTICRNWTKEDLSSGVRELGGPSCGIYAPDATVGGSFIWKNVKKISSSNGRNILFWLDLPGSKATTIEDDENSWRALDRLDVTGFQYSNVMDLAGEVGWRLPVLDREYAIKNGGRLHNLGFALLLLWRALQRRLSASNQPLLRNTEDVLSRCLTFSLPASCEAPDMRTPRVMYLFSLNETGHGTAISACGDNWADGVWTGPCYTVSRPFGQSCGFYYGPS